MMLLNEANEEFKMLTNVTCIIPGSGYTTACFAK